MFVIFTWKSWLTFLCTALYYIVLTLYLCAWRILRVSALCWSSHGGDPRLLTSATERQGPSWRTGTRSLSQVGFWSLCVLFNVCWWKCDLCDKGHGLSLCRLLWGQGLQSGVRSVWGEDPSCPATVTHISVCLSLL